MISYLSSSLPLKAAEGIHSKIIKLGFGSFQSIISSLVTLYASCRSHSLASQLLDETPRWDFGLISTNLMIAAFIKIGEINIAKKIFRKMPTCDVVTWNTIISGCVKNSHSQEALRIFQKMLKSNVEPDAFTFSSVIAACARLGARDCAEWIHNLMIEKCISLNYILGAALIDMYSRCGRIEKAKEIFKTIEKNEVSIWNTMINGFAIHGLAFDAISIFSSMPVEKISPDSITFVGILTACSHCGLVEEGRKYFDMMRCHSIEPQLEHYGAMIDLFGRAGLLNDAYAMIKDMPMEPDVVIWRSLLSACRTQRNNDLGELVIKKIENLKSGDYVLLSNIYCSVNKWDTAEQLRNAMKMNRVRKKSGKSWIEISGVIHQFNAGDLSHLERDAVLKILEKLIQRTKRDGYIHTKELVLMDVSDEEKEENLNYHSEKLALAYGILKTSPGTEIQITKNLRTCIDCHVWLKIVSKMLNRVINVRDRVRFHRFEGGLCSCRDFW